MPALHHPGAADAIIEAADSPRLGQMLGKLVEAPVVLRTAHPYGLSPSLRFEPVLNHLVAQAAIDGCILACARSCLAERGVTPTDHILLAESGVSKKYHTDFDPAEADRVYGELNERLSRPPMADPS